MSRIAVWPAILVVLLTASCGGFPGLTDREYREGYADGFTNGCVPWPADKARALAAATAACQTAAPGGEPEYRIGWQAGFMQAAYMGSSASRPLFDPLPPMRGAGVGSGSSEYVPLFEEPEDGGLAGGATP